jgi:hypothetical protein
MVSIGRGASIPPVESPIGFENLDALLSAEQTLLSGGKRNE